MTAATSTMLELGTAAPDFDLPDPDGKRWRLADFGHADALVVAFICNHCPFVKHIRRGIAAFAREYVGKNVAMVAVNSNDIVAYPGDAPEHMREVARQFDFVFPYLFDETQDLARAYRAACTPDFYVFDKNRKLVYRGQFDAARPGNDEPVTGRDVRRAVDAVLEGRQPGAEQKPSIGCNIKWKSGQAPDYAR